MKTTSAFLFFFSLICSCITYGQAKDIKIELMSNSISVASLKTVIETNTSNFLNEINSLYLQQKSLDNNLNYITKDAINKTNEILFNSPFYVSESYYLLSVLHTQKGYQLRNIMVQAGDKKQSLVIDFLSNGIIDDVYFGLELHQYRGVMNFNSVVDRTRREIILNFVENFRTAYVRKDIDLIKKVFSDQALIITGKVIQADDNNLDIFKTTFSEQQIEYQVLTKSQYIDRLQNVFSTTSHINLLYENIEVIQHKKFPDFYGVQLNQSWITSNYSDQGFLFLLIQFRKNDNPLIWVRTWQSIEDVDKENAFGLHNFKIYENDI